VDAIERGDQFASDSSAALELNGLLALGQQRQAAHDLPGALASFEKALSLAQPELSAAILCNMGAANQALVRLADAEDCYRRAIDANPSLAEASYNLGCLLLDQGRFDPAEQCLQRALELRPQFHQAHSALLCLYGLHRNRDQQALLEAHRRWGEAHASGYAPLVRREDVDASPERRITIGYVSADLREHSVSYFIEPVLAGHDKSRFRVICYDNWAGEDPVNQRLRQYAEWRRIADLDDDAAARLIRSDGVDILVDLSGHTAGNRLLVFARRPAPIQASWFGYMCTTGLAAMDYRITDAYLDPPGATERFYTERLVRISAAAGFSPDPDSPAVNAPPSQGNGHVTFGSFNNYTKVGDEVITAWARILNAVPGARLLLVALAGDSEGVKGEIAARFARLGLADGAQLDIRGRRPLRGFLSMLQEVDISLDSFPYSGGTTSLHTLWMGVPIVAIEGESELQKSTAGMLRGADAEALVAFSVEEYCAKAVSLAGDAAQLAQWRGSLRERARNSPVFATGEVTASLEGAYREMWHTWVQNSGTKPPRAA
jgi:predicted O-linked N-acetylglucosamine transferase (SPINDLY family)